MTEGPPLKPAWLNFRRMQRSACWFGSLVYLLAVLRAWEVLPGDSALKFQLFLAFPGVFFLFALITPLSNGPLRRWLKKYVWMSFAAGFGQSVPSVLGGLGVLAVAAAFVFAQIAGHSDGGRYPAGIFSAYAAGVGVLFAQALLASRLEREPDVRKMIEG
jgi:hypothetical protein